VEYRLADYINYESRNHVTCHEEALLDGSIMSILQDIIKNMYLCLARINVQTRLGFIANPESKMIGIAIGGVDLLGKLMGITETTRMTRLNSEMPLSGSKKTSDITTIEGMTRYKIVFRKYCKRLTKTFQIFLLIICAQLLKMEK
jgi:hypothetical protein